MKRFIITLVVVLSSIPLYAQISSPYVEPGTLIINNSGFKATSIRTTPVTRPTPMHVRNEPANATFPARFVVAKADLLFNDTWAWACGWNLTANTVVSGVLPIVIPTGCAAYFELGLDAIIGTWRVPTQREMNLIVISRFELAATAGYTQLGANGTYWTSTQDNATQAWAITMNTHSMYARDKNLFLSTRCVRDLY